jgi:hypothetical protein
MDVKLGTIEQNDRGELRPKNMYVNLVCLEPTTFWSRGSCDDNHGVSLTFLLGVGGISI